MLLPQRFFARVLSLAAAAVLAVSGLKAQYAPRASYPEADAMGFDMWCQEEERYPMARCDARSPDDIRAYEAYRAMMENYRTEARQETAGPEDEKNRADRNPSDTAQDDQDAMP